MVKKILGKFYIYFILLLMYLPILVLIFFSFQEIVTIRFDAISTPSFKLYVDLFDFSLRQTNEIWIAVLHTIEIALAAAGVSTIIGTLGAIGIFYSRKI